jgi:hypothetical protein
MQRISFSLSLVLDYDKARSSPLHSSHPRPILDDHRRRNPFQHLRSSRRPTKTGRHMKRTYGLTRRNAKVQPTSPPEVIQDMAGCQVPCDIKECFSLERSASTYLDLIWSLPTLTSKGGFARVYQVWASRNTYLACKVVTKSSLKPKKAKTKVRAHCV